MIDFLREVLKEATGDVLANAVWAGLLLLFGAVAWRFGRKPLQSVGKDLTLRWHVRRRPWWKRWFGG